MTKKFWIMNGSNDKKEDDDKGIETALSVPGAFAGKCFNCGKDGHKRHECFKKPQQFMGNCSYCSQCGHKAEWCWEEEENAHK